MNGQFHRGLTVAKADRVFCRRTVSQRHLTVGALGTRRACLERAGVVRIVRAVDARGALGILVLRALAHGAEALFAHGARLALPRGQVKVQAGVALADGVVRGVARGDQFGVGAADGTLATPFRVAGLGTERRLRALLLAGGADGVVVVATVADHAPARAALLAAAHLVQVELVVAAVETRHGALRKKERERRMNEKIQLERPRRNSNVREQGPGP